MPSVIEQECERIMTRSSPQRQTLLRKCSIFYRTALSAGVLAAGLAACSALPDAVNPVEWYRGVAGVFESDEQQQERATEEKARQATPLPGTDKPYPNLATVPDRPRITSPAERGKVAQGLLADRENARYAESESSRGEAPVAEQVGAAPPLSPLPEPPPPAAAAAMAAPRVAQPEPVQAPRPAMPQSAMVQARETPMPVPTMPREATFPLGMTQSATVFFANGSAAIDTDGKRALRILAEGFKENGGTLRLVGFASGQAASANAQITNFRIAGQRAEAVAQELVQLGVPINRMTVSSGNAGAGDAALARRVEVSLDY